MRKQEYTSDKSNKTEAVYVPLDVQKSIIIDYFHKTYYWATGFLAFLSGLLLGILIG